MLGKTRSKGNKRRRIRVWHAKLGVNRNERRRSSVWHGQDKLGVKGIKGDGAVYGMIN